MGVALADSALYSRAMSKTIGRNATRKIATIKSRTLTCHTYSLGNNFIAQECDQEYAWKQLETYDFARLLDDGDGRYTIRIHSNCWFRLTEA